MVGGEGIADEALECLVPELSPELRDGGLVRVRRGFEMPELLRDLDLRWPVVRADRAGGEQQIDQRERRDSKARHDRLSGRRPAG
jgi:hypothetical protein